MIEGENEVFKAIEEILKEEVAEGMPKEIIKSQKTTSRSTSKSIPRSQWDSFSRPGVQKIKGDSMETKENPIRFAQSEELKENRLSQDFMVSEALKNFKETRMINYKESEEKEYIERSQIERIEEFDEQNSKESMYSGSSQEVRIEIPRLFITPLESQQIQIIIEKEGSFGLKQTDSSSEEVTEDFSKRKGDQEEQKPNSCCHEAPIQTQPSNFSNPAGTPLLKAKMLQDSQRNCFEIGLRASRVQVVQHKSDIGNMMSSAPFGKSDFQDLQVIGQFNKGFIATFSQRTGRLLLIDQHAADEKRNFEDYILNGKIGSHCFVQPTLLKLTLDQRYFLREKLEVFKKNGFVLKETPSNDESLVPDFLLCSVPTFMNRSFKIEGTFFIQEPE